MKREGRAITRIGIAVIALALSTGCKKPSSKGSGARDATAGPVPDAGVHDAASVRDAAPPAPAATAELPDDPEVAPEGPVPVFPVPPAPKGADPQAVAIVSSICAAGYTKNAGAIDVGCRSHPPFTKRAQMPNGKLVRQAGDPAKLCAVRRIYRGSFSRPGASQAVVSFGECYEDGVAYEGNSTTSLSILLVEEEAGRWKSKAYIPHQSASSCGVSRLANGRDVLLCQCGADAGFQGNLTAICDVDFARPRARMSTVAWMFEDQVICSRTNMISDGLPAGLTKLRVKNPTYEDVNHDGALDMVLEVERAHAPPSPTLEADVKAACARNHDAKDESFVPAFTKTRIEIVSGPSGFAPTAASQKELAKWESEGPEGFYGLTAGVPPKL